MTIPVGWLFFFQAEDGIRDLTVTGVQTCALPICSVPSSMPTIVTIVGIELGTLLGGSVITETIFAWPGVGRLSVQAIYNRDYRVVQAAVFLLSTRSEEHTSELQSQSNLVCRLLLEKKKNTYTTPEVYNHTYL